MKSKTQKPATEKLMSNYEDYKSEIEKLETKYNGRLSPLDIVREASDNKSPLHSWFDWNDSVASEKWRVHQARLLLNSIKVKVMFEDGHKEYRKYLNVRVPVTDEENNKEFKRFYVETEKIMSNPDMKEQILQRAIAEAKYWKRTYEDYMELENIFSAISKTEKKLKKKKKILVEA